MSEDGRHDNLILKQIADAGDAETIIDKAKKAIYGQRQRDYGDAKTNHERIAGIWSVVLGQPVTAEQVVLCMIGLKMARLCHTPSHEDSWVDIVGYAGVWDKMQKGE